jgi:PAS domain S-box-containing protein
MADMKVNKRRAMTDSTIELHRCIADNRNIFDSILSGIIIIDVQDHTIVDINPAACTMFGDAREHVIGSICHEYICPAEEGKCPITDLGQTVDHSERKLVCANGEICPVLKTVTLVQFDGRDYLIEAITDISVQKKTEAELQKHKIPCRNLLMNAPQNLPGPINPLSIASGSSKRSRKTPGKGNTCFRS